MPGRPPEDSIEFQYHDIQMLDDSDDLRRWVVFGNHCVMIPLLPGPLGSWTSEGIEKRVAEYDKILRRMRERRRQSLEAEITKEAIRLRNERRTDWNLPETRSQHEIAEELRKAFPVAPEFGITISREYVSRAINAGMADVERHVAGGVSGNSISVGTSYGRKPPLCTD